MGVCTLTPANASSAASIFGPRAPVWIPYFTSTFNATAASRVDAIAVLGAYGSSRSFNGPYPCHYEFNSPRFSEDPLNANITQQQVMDSS